MVVLYLKNILNMSYQKNDKANKTIVLRRDFNINLLDLDIGKRVQIFANFGTVPAINKATRVTMKNATATAIDHVFTNAVCWKH